MRSVLFMRTTGTVQADGEEAVETAEAAPAAEAVTPMAVETPAAETPAADPVETKVRDRQAIGLFCFFGVILSYGHMFHVSATLSYSRTP